MSTAEPQAVVWVNGELRPASDPIVTAGDHGLTVGDGVYETLRVVNGQPFALTRHLARLERSLVRVGMREVDEGTVREGVAQLLAAHAGALTRLRITAVSGPGPAGARRGTGASTVIISGATGVPPRECRAVTSPWRRNEHSAIVGVKSTSHAENVVTLEYALARGADEAVVLNTAGDLCEGTGTNVFVERGGEILTPALASGCLGGITRGLALEWGQQAGLPLREAEPGELAAPVLDELKAGVAWVAVSSATRGVQPVVWLDGIDLTQGALLTRLAGVYRARADEDGDPAPRAQHGPM